MISSLRYAISRDRNYFVKAAIDPMFKKIRSQIDSLLNDILEETKKNVQIKVSNLEKYMKKMEKWFSGNYASSGEVQLYNSIKHKIKEIYSKLSLNTYFDYVDALQLASSANEELRKIQLSIKNTVTSSEDRIISNEKKLKDTSYELSNKRRKYHKDMLINVVLGVFTPLIIIYGCFWFYNVFFSGSGLDFDPVKFILGAIILGIIGGLLGPLLLPAIMLMFVNFFSIFDPIKEYESYKKKAINTENVIKEENIILKQIIPIAKESII
ncbi:hypothetical protein [Methanosarcina soligelidi]|uniref:hypothetical protein n=1 Tax=Methanosarcina soligelidi TaxID=1036677 RepID=UPI00064E4D5D|nr:hypothetical protein [Methanosarcina soligelidi]